MSEIKLDENKLDGAIVLSLGGRLDSNTSDAFEEKLLGKIRGGESKVVLDFAGLDYISSAGLRVLLKAARELKQKDGKMHLCCLKDYIKEVFDLSGFISFLPIFETTDEAVKAL